MIAMNQFPLPVSRMRRESTTLLCSSLAPEDRSLSKSALHKAGDSQSAGAALRSAAKIFPSSGLASVEK